MAAPAWWREENILGIHNLIDRSLDKNSCGKACEGDSLNPAAVFNVLCNVLACVCVLTKRLRSVCPPALYYVL